MQYNRARYDTRPDTPSIKTSTASIRPTGVMGSVAGLWRVINTASRTLPVQYNHLVRVQTSHEITVRDDCLMIDH